MYPHAELTRLAAHKDALRRNIAGHRVRCAKSAARLAEPFAWLDRTLAAWKRLAPLTQIVAVPLALLVTRNVFPRLKFLRSLVRWSPLVFGAVRGLGSAFKTHAGSRQP